MALFGNPAKAAQPYLNQIPGAVSPYYQPYIQQGQQAGSQAASVYERMSQDPTSFINQLMSSYSPSKGFQFQKDLALKEQRNTAAQGGFSGTQYDQMRQAELANSLANKDMYTWLNTVLGAQGAGLSGQQQLANQGFGASTSLGDIMGSNLAQQGALAFQGQNARNQQLSGLLGAGAGLAGMGATNYLRKPQSVNYSIAQPQQYAPQPLDWNQMPGIGFSTPPYSQYKW